jgi:hypothetical protein
VPVAVPPPHRSLFGALPLAAAAGTAAVAVAAGLYSPKICSTADTTHHTATATYFAASTTPDYR